MVQNNDITESFDEKINDENYKIDYDKPHSHYLQRDWIILLNHIDLSLR